MVSVNNSLSCKLNPGKNSSQCLRCCRPHPGVLVGVLMCQQEEIIVVFHSCDRGKLTMVKTPWEVKIPTFFSGGRFRFPFMPLTCALRFTFKIYHFCTSRQILELCTCNFSHLSHAAAVKENFPFVRTCTYWSQQVKRSEDVIYTFFCELWKRKENWLTLHQQSWNYTVKRIL